LFVRFDKGLDLEDDWVCKAATGLKSYYQRMLAIRYGVECIFLLNSLLEENVRKVDVSFKKLVEIEPTKN